MLDKTEFFNHFTAVAKETLPVVLYSSNELQVRCPFCGDSSKNSRSAHLYISNKYPFPFNCFRCPAAGRYLTYELVNKLGINDAEVRIFTKKLAKEKFANVNSINRKKVITDLTNRKRLLIPEPSSLDKEKIKYINTRLGRKISKNDITRYKLIFSLIDFLNLNNINEYTSDTQRIEFIDEQFFGNLSLDETNITFRNIHEQVTNRYRLYSLYNIQNKSKTFSITKDINLYTPEFKIIIAEGVLDLMQIEHEFYTTEEKEKDNYLAVAINGNSFSYVINEILSLGLFPATIDLYIDNEYKAIEKISKDLKRLRIFNSNYISINVYMNNQPNVKGKQDFGVPLSEIRRSKIRLL